MPGAQLHRTEFHGDTVTVHHFCTFCNKPSQVTVDRKGYQMWTHGTKVQLAFPDVPPGQREILITGTHPECWDKYFGDSEEE